MKSEYSKLGIALVTDDQGILYVDSGDGLKQAISVNLDELETDILAWKNEDVFEKNVLSEWNQVKDAIATAIAKIIVVPKSHVYTWDMEGKCFPWRSRETLLLETRTGKVFTVFSDNSCQPAPELAVGARIGVEGAGRVTVPCTVSGHPTGCRKDWYWTLPSCREGAWDHYSKGSVKPFATTKN